MDSTKRIPVAHVPPFRGIDGAWDNPEPAGTEEPSPDVTQSWGGKVDIDELCTIHKETCLAAFETMQRKNHDYTSGSGDVFANFNGSTFVGVHPVIGILMRTMDKFQRIRTFIEQGKLEVAEESWEDAIEDSINYLILAKARLREQVRTGI